MSLFDEIWQLASFIEEQARALWSIIQSFFGILSTIYSIISDFMALFPEPIQILIMLGVSVASFYYIYNWIKDIAIAGFKV